MASAHIDVPGPKHNGWQVDVEIKNTETEGEYVKARHEFFIRTFGLGAVDGICKTSEERPLKGTHGPIMDLIKEFSVSTVKLKGGQVGRSCIASIPFQTEPVDTRHCL